MVSHTKSRSRRAKSIHPSLNESVLANNIIDSSGVFHEVNRFFKKVSTKINQTIKKYHYPDDIPLDTRRKAVSAITQLNLVPSQLRSNEIKSYEPNKIDNCLVFDTTFSYHLGRSMTPTPFEKCYSTMVVLDIAVRFWTGRVNGPIINDLKSKCTLPWTLFFHENGQPSFIVSMDSIKESYNILESILTGDKLINMDPFDTVIRLFRFYCLAI